MRFCSKKSYFLEKMPVARVIVQQSPLARSDTSLENWFRNVFNSLETPKIGFPINACDKEPLVCAIPNLTKRQIAFIESDAMDYRGLYFLTNE